MAWVKMHRRMSRMELMPSAFVHKHFILTENNVLIYGTHENLKAKCFQLRNQFFCFLGVSEICTKCRASIATIFGGSCFKVKYSQQNRISSAAECKMILRSQRILFFQQIKMFAVKIIL